MKSYLSAAFGGFMLLATASDAVAALEEVAVIGTRSETSLLELPGNVAVLSAEQLEILGANHVQQALAQVPGVGWQRGNGQESLPSIRSAVLTGAGACGNVLVLEEAIPVRGAGFCNVNEMFDTHYEQASRLEVVRGANTAFYGSNALLGSINVHLPVAGQDFVALELGANDYWRFKGSLGLGDESGRLYLTLTDDGGFRDESGYAQQKLSWRHQAQLGEWDVALGATYTRLDQETAGFVNGFESYRDPDLRRRNFDPEAFRKSDSLRAWARFERQLGDQVFSITPYLRSTQMDFLQHFLPGDPLEQNEQDGVGWQSSLTGQLGSSLQWTLGLDGEFSAGELLQTQDAPTSGSAFLQATIPAGVHYDYEVDMQQFGGFAHLHWQPAERWRVLAGLRVEHLRYDYDNRGLDGRSRDDGTLCGFGGCRYSRPADRKDSFTYASPKVEVQYQAGAAWRWHFAIADAHRAPQATELYRLQRAQQVADLDEVEAGHIEAGVRRDTEAGSFALSVYQIRQSNVIIRDADFFNVDGQKIDSTGVELSWFQQWSPDWSSRVVASLADHEYASDQVLGGVNINGLQVDTAPAFFGSASLSWQPSDRLSGEVQVQHVAEYYLEPANQFEYPGHTLVNLRAQYQVAPQWQASVRLLNLTDRLYAERADYTSFTEYRYFPGEGRSVFAELRYNFD